MTPAARALLEGCRQFFKSCVCDHPTWAGELFNRIDALLAQEGEELTEQRSTRPLTSMSLCSSGSLSECGEKASDSAINAGVTQGRESLNEWDGKDRRKEPEAAQESRQLYRHRDAQLCEGDQSHVSVGVTGNPASAAGLTPCSHSVWSGMANYTASETVWLSKRCLSCGANLLLEGERGE